MIATTLAATPHRRAIVASAVLGAILLGLLVAAVLGWLSLADRSDLLDRRWVELQATAARARARGPGLARAERTLAADPFLPGDGPSQAANGLQTRIVALAEACGVTLKTIGAEPVVDVEPGTLPHVNLQASAVGRIAALQKLLYRIETEAPFVLVEDVTARAPQGGGGGLGFSRDPELEVELRLVGYLHRKGG